MAYCPFSWESGCNEATILFMVALLNRADHYIFALWFLYFFFLLFFAHLISAVGDWMSTVLPHIWCGPSVNLECRSETCCTRLAENTARKKSPKSCHLGTIAQLCRAISSQLRHVSTIGKKPVKQQYLHLYSAGRPSRWALAHISSLFFFLRQWHWTGSDIKELA